MFNDKVVTRFVSKYALTKGIAKEEGEIRSDSKIFCVRCNNFWHYYRNCEYHETLQEAIEQAEKMRLKKIESLKKQIAKLEKMVIKKPE